MEQEIDEQDVIETPVEESPEVPETPEDTVESLQEKNKQLFARAKTAEGFVFENGTWVKKPKPVETKPDVLQNNQTLSPIDLYALMDAKVPQVDVEEVTKMAKLLGISVPDALKDESVKTILERRASFRRTAEATNTSTARPGTKKVTDDELLNDLSKGNVPEKGSKNAEELFWARRGGKK